MLLDVSSYATEKELEDASGVDTSNLVAKKDFIVLNKVKRSSKTGPG